MKEGIGECWARKESTWAARVVPGRSRRVPLMTSPIPKAVGQISAHAYAQASQRPVAFITSMISPDFLVRRGGISLRYRPETETENDAEDAQEVIDQEPTEGLGRGNMSRLISRNAMPLRCLTC